MGQRNGDQLGSDAHHLPTAAWFALLQDALAAQGRLRIPLRGTSMRPTLPAHCTVLVEPVRGAVQPGMVVVYNGGEELLTHRLVRRWHRGWIAQGDGQRRPDPPFVEEQILGIVVGVYNGENQRIWPRRWSALAAYFWIGRHYLWATWRALRPSWWRRWRRTGPKPAPRPPS